MQILKSLLIIGLSSFLFACTMFSHSNTNSKATGPQTSGLGIAPAFDGQGQYTQQQLLAQKTILFAFDKTKIQEKYLPVIAAHAHYLSQHSQQTILLAGNTDQQGSREYNMGLGGRRAQSMADALLANGVAKTRIIQVSYGPELPAVCGQLQAAYAQNRRVDILYCESSNCKKVAKSYANKSCSST